MKSMVELIEMVFERTWPGGHPNPRLRGLRIAGHPTTPHTLNIVAGLLQRPTSAAPAHPRASHRPTRPSRPTPRSRRLKHRDYATRTRRAPPTPAEHPPHRLTPRWGRATTSPLFWTMDYMDFMDERGMVGRRWSVGAFKIHAIDEIHG
jgi:hypothetical protein